MVTVLEATEITRQHLWKGGQEFVPLLDSMNRVLAEPIAADRDLPPFHRVTMDGIAIKFESFSRGQTRFPVAFVQAAGTPQQKLADDSNCCEVMTGAILPEGTDTVVRYEDCSIENGMATITSGSIRKGENIHVQGIDAKRGDGLLNEGLVISSAEIPVLASVGKANVWVKSLPRVALVSTGDELVEVEHTPLAHQIRKSNMYALAAALSKRGIQSEFFHLMDNENSIATALDEILSQFDLIILSGGVSKGKFDLIPRMLEAKGIKKKFHQISQRPGKPMWFGVGENKTVFALPGNPVSTFLCYYRYVEPWLTASLGAFPKTEYAILGSDFTFDAPLTYFLQVRIDRQSGQVIAFPIPGGGSGDFVNLMEVDGFLELPVGGNRFRAGDVFRFIGFREA
jgi:molybdopterin molybdotransferase